MNDDQLKIYLTLTETGSFTKAEKKMHITKQAMMKQMNHLEEELEVQLFIRSRSGIRLTKAGEIFRKGVLKINREMTNLIHSCREAQNTAGILRIGNVEHQALLTPVTRVFSIRYPEIRLQTVIHPNHSGEWRVANGIQDVAETFYLAYRMNSLGMSYQSLTKVPYVAAMRKAHPLAGRKQAALTDLSRYETMLFPIMLEEEQTDAVRTAFARHADNLIERNDVDHQVEVAYECINSDRILITANPFIENISDLVKIPLKNGWVREYGILYKEPISDAVRKYIETAVEVYQA